MKKSAIYFALTALFTAACADAPVEEGSPAGAESTLASDAEADGLEAAKAGGPIETDAKCTYTTCMTYCIKEHSFHYCDSLCSKCNDGGVFLGASSSTPPALASPSGVSRAQRA